MTYRAAVRIPGLPVHPEPRIYCDGEGCTASIAVTRASGMPYAWFLAGKAPPKWKAEPIDEFRNRHWCPRCREATP